MTATIDRSECPGTRHGTRNDVRNYGCTCRDARDDRNAYERGLREAAKLPQKPGPSRILKVGAAHELYMEALVPLAMRYVAAIHDDGPDAAREVLDDLARIPTPPGITAPAAFLTVIAAMVDPTKPASELLGWVRPPVRSNVLSMRPTQRRQRSRSRSA